MDELIKFLQDNKETLKYSHMEIELGMARGTVSRVTNGYLYRNFTPDQRKAILAYLKKLGKKIGTLILAD